MINGPLSGKSPMKASKLIHLTADNFQVFYKAHLYHLNVTGPNFPQYHDLFGEVYGKLYEWHDTLCEQVRQDGELFPLNLGDITRVSAVNDDAAGASVSTYLASLCTDLDGLLTTAEAIYKTADPALETVIGEYCADVKKLKWKIDATKGSSK